MRKLSMTASVSHRQAGRKTMDMRQAGTATPPLLAARFVITQRAVTGAESEY